jgi:hypothetical protein
MRNKYPGYCYRCGGYVAKKEGHFERYKNTWKIQHADCAIKYRGTNHHHIGSVIIKTKKEK